MILIDERVPEMRFYFEIGNKSGQHFRILPIHLHMIYLSIDSDGRKQLIEVESLKDEVVSTDIYPLKMIEIFIYDL